MAFLDILTINGHTSLLRKLLGDADNVVITDPEEGNVLTYDEENEIWVNGTATGITFDIVNELPAQGESNKIYFVPKVDGGDNDNYKEYVWINDAFELLGGGEEEPSLTYGFFLTEAPDSVIDYADDCSHFDPIQIDTQTGAVISYGSWENAFFWPKPCMLKYDGTVDYYLDPSDYSKKADGTPSDVSNESYGGNAMMEWPIIYVDIIRVGTDVYHIKIKNKPHEGFTCWSNINAAGEKVNFYTPIYNGSIDSNGRLRSLSGKTIASNIDMQESLDAAALNGSGWNIETFSDRSIINLLLMLVGKGLNTQAIFGAGFVTGGNADNMKLTGTLDDKGLFYGLTDESIPVKVFGMENYWGQQSRRIVGFVENDYTSYIKMTEGTEDGSTVVGYNTTGAGYLEFAPAPRGSGYITQMVVAHNAMVPSERIGGSSTTYYCDTVTANSSGGGPYPARLCGSSTNGQAAGAFRVFLSTAPETKGWDTGAALSYR